jgi:O-antigen/teichoic acid export membrane protein
LTDSPSLGTRALRGVLWTGSASLVQLVVIAMVYKKLPAQIMGNFEWALMLVMLLALIGDLGLGAALVQRRDATEEHFHAAFWTNLGWGLLLAALLGWSAPLLALATPGEDPEELARLFRLLCLLIPLASISSVFRARLQRDLDFGAVALSEIVSVLAFGLCTLALLSRYQVAAVAVGSVFREAGLLASLCWSAQWCPRLSFRPVALRQLMAFALNFTGSRVIGFLNTYIAGFVIFPLLGSTAMGYYRLAERFTLQPLTRLATTINRVSFPAFSTIQDDDALLRQGYLRSVQSLLLSMGSLLAGLFVFAPELLDLLDYAPALMVLRLLVVATLLKVVGTMVGSVFMAKGRTDWSLYWSLFSLVVLVPSMYFSVPYGVEGIAWVIAGSSLLFLAISQVLASRLIGLALTEYLYALLRPFLVVLVVLAVLGLARPFLPGPPPLVLAQGLVLGLLVGALSLRLLAWSLCLEYWRRLRGAPPA